MRIGFHSVRDRFAIFAPGASLGIFAVSCLISACDDDTGQGRGIDLANSWPNDDGRYWVYEETTFFWSDSLQLTVYPNPGEVPSAPTLDEVVALLQEPLEGVPLGTAPGTYRLQFDGTMTTDSGAMGQNLRAWIDDIPVAVAKGGGVASPGKSWEGGTVASGFLAQLRRARPDLAPKTTPWPAVRADTFDVIPTSPTLLGGGAWEKTEAHIGLYGVFDLDLAWKYLEADLRIGHEFTFQLIPSLASDVFLHTRVHASGSIETQNGVYDHGLEVVYLVDFGILEVLDPEGATIGYSRAFSIGSVVYVADVGPVWSEERNLYFVGTTPAGPVETLTLDLQETGRPTMAAHR